MTLNSKIAHRSFEDDEIIAEALMLLVRKHLSYAMQACSRRSDPSEVTHFMGEAHKVMNLRQQLNA